jgi:hypothetical protein
MDGHALELAHRSSVDAANHERRDACHTAHCAMTYSDDQNCTALRRSPRPATGRRGQDRQDKVAQISIVLPLTPCTVKTPLVSTVKTIRPTFSVVDGPAGTSVGKRIRTLCPVSVSTYDPSGLYVLCVTAPLDFVENVSPVARFVKRSAAPVPASRTRTTLPLASLNSFRCRLPPKPSMRRSN